jgi:hypothetical protein
MPSVAFDTLKFAQKLEKAGFPMKQAQDMAAAQAEAVSEWQSNLNLATKADLDKTENALRESIQRLEAQTGQRFAEVNQRIADKSAETIKWLIGMSFAQAGLIIGILKMTNG